MVGWMVRTAFSALATAALVYVVFFVPVGRHTLYHHGARILATAEAQELRGSIAELVDRAEQRQ